MRNYMGKQFAQRHLDGLHSRQQAESTIQNK